MIETCTEHDRRSMHDARTCKGGALHLKSGATVSAVTWPCQFSPRPSTCTSKEPPALLGTPNTEGAACCSLLLCAQNTCKCPIHSACSSPSQAWGDWMRAGNSPCPGCSPWPARLRPLPSGSTPASAPGTADRRADCTAPEEHLVRLSPCWVVKGTLQMTSVLAAANWLGAVQSVSELRHAAVDSLLIDVSV